MNNKMKVLALGAVLLGSGTAFAGTSGSVPFNTGDTADTQIDLSVSFQANATLTLTALSTSGAGASSSGIQLDIAGNTIPTSDLFGAASATFANASVANAGYVRKNTGAVGSEAKYAVGATAAISGAVGVDKFDLSVTNPADPAADVLSASEILAAGAALPTDGGFTGAGSLGDIAIDASGDGSAVVFVGFEIQNTFDSSGAIAGVFGVTALSD